MSPLYTVCAPSTSRLPLELPQPGEQLRGEGALCTVPSCCVHYPRFVKHMGFYRMQYFDIIK